MVWPVGQPNAEIEALALRSRELWQVAAAEAGFWHRACGSLHLAYEAEELAVLREFAHETSNRLPRTLLSADEAHAHCPAIRRDGLKGALLSATEHAVDPREVVHRLADSLASAGVTIRFGVAVTRIRSGQVTMAGGETVRASAVVVCAGPWLFEHMGEAATRDGLDLCHLQMLRLEPKPGTPSLGIHLCAGLTLDHYKNFRDCPSLPAVRARHAEKWAAQVAHGIHVLVAEHADGTLTVGDSHTYGRAHPVYAAEAVDELILTAMNEFLPRDRYTIRQRWIGTYPTHPTLPYWQAQVEDGVWALNLFGTGMTLSFGVTERLKSEILISV
jgi:FAD dependent oxidoreductase TIGR03364